MNELDHQLSKPGEGHVILTNFTTFHEDSIRTLTKPNAENPYQDGLDAGLAQAKVIHEETVKTMEQSLQHLGASFRGIRDDIEASHGRVVRMCLDAALSGLASKSMQLELESLINGLASATLEGVLKVYCHPDNAFAKDFLGDAPFDISISVTNDANLMPHKVVCEWQDGAASIDPDAVGSAIKSILFPTFKT